MRYWTLLLIAVPFCALAQRPEMVVPTDPDTVLARLPNGYAELMPQADARAPEKTPAEDRVAISRIQALLATAASAGDARLVARAEGALAQLPPTDDRAAVLLARAYAAQYRHEFSTARSLLDRLLQQSPRNASARLARAQMLLVQGDLKAARSDCVALALVDSGRGLICVAAWSLRRGAYETAAAALDRWIQRNQGGGDAMLRYALVMRGQVASRAGDDRADAWFQRALALGPDDVRSLAAYARHLRGSDRPAEAFRLLADAPTTDHLLLERALAAYAARLPQAPALADRVAERFALARSVGTTPDLRDEARFLLILRDDPAAALQLAQENFETQRDYEDVSLLRRAARAAGQPQALQGLQAWARSQGLQLAPIDGEDA